MSNVVVYQVFCTILTFCYGFTCFKELNCVAWLVYNKISMLLLASCSHVNQPSRIQLQLRSP